MLITESPESQNGYYIKINMAIHNTKGIWAEKASKLSLVGWPPYGITFLASLVNGHTGINQQRLHWIYSLKAESSEGE